MEIGNRIGRTADAGGARARVPSAHASSQRGRVRAGFFVIEALIRRLTQERLATVPATEGSTH
jgi:hypothetical protein